MIQNTQSFDLASIVARALEILDGDDLLSLVEESTQSPRSRHILMENQSQLARLGYNGENQPLHSLMNWGSVARQDSGHGAPRKPQ
jgi:hypothetical protein